MLHIPRFLSFRLRSALLGMGLLVLLAIAGCGRATGPSSEVPLTLRATVSPSDDRPMAMTFEAPADTAPVTYSRALLVVREVRFKVNGVGDDDDDDGDDDDGEDDLAAGFMASTGVGDVEGLGQDNPGWPGHGRNPHDIIFTGPYIVDLLSQTADSLDTQLVPPGNYHSTRGYVAPLRVDDWNAGENAFLVGYTVHLEGTVDGDGGEFTFQTPLYRKFNIKGKFTVEEETPATAFLTFDLSHWLVAPNGEFLDPRNPANEAAIQRAISKSIRLVWDDDHDGKCDDDEHREDD